MRNRERRDEERAVRLRERLREGDPASGPGLAPEEVWEMRRRMLAALPERRRPRLLWALASAAVAALALALGLTLHHEVPPPARTATAAPPAAAPRPATVAIVPAAPAPAPAARPLRAARRSRRPARAAVVAAASVPPPPVAPPAAPLQIQFDTPGGTRVVWVLEPAKP